LRICIVLSSSPDSYPRGGLEKATYSLLEGLSRAGTDLLLLASGTDEDRPWEGVPTLRLAHSHGRMLMRGARDWNAAVHEALDRVRPDVVIAQGLGYAGAAVTTWHGAPRIVVAHGNIAEDMRHVYSRAGWTARVPLVRARAAKIARRADAVVNVTQDWWVNCPVEPTRQVYIPNAVEDVFFTTKRRAKPDTVVCFGGAASIKGVDLLLESWPEVVRSVPCASLTVYGDASGPPRALPLQCQVKGAIASSEQMADTLGGASVVVIPSRFEVSPMVAAEAMALGFPIVANDVGGVRAMTTGVAALCPVDPPQIAAAVISALQGDDVWEARIRAGLKRSASFTVENVAAAFLALFESLRNEAGQ
jgi:glycosyltransferase involved in cell wall biosynthesis